MPDQTMRQDRDLVLPPGTYAFVLDQTKGFVNVYVGPTRTSLSNTDQLVTWTGKRFMPVTDLSQAVQPFVKANESQYVVLTDPAEDGAEHFPPAGTASNTVPLDPGKKIVIPGPANFALWPGQTADIIDGHHLSYNEYLVVQVYEPVAARENWERTIAAPQTGEEAEEVPRQDHGEPEFTMGQRIVIRGTRYSYWVPPTGIEVVPERGESGKSYVRSAATLEQLEYCVLVDENGRKRYEKGPAVVFPEPTETFIVEKRTRKFRAIELNPQSGLYIKVLADYVNEEDRTVEASRGSESVKIKRGEMIRTGDELFETGKAVPIYFPQPEHSVIHYGEQRKHHAVAVPTGEGRYVLDRTTGEVDTVVGPKMFLPDPRTQVVVRRVLDDDEVQVMYPGNAEARRVNDQLRTELSTVEEDFLPAAAASTGEAGSLARSYNASAQFAGERMRRGTEYTPPRTITLDTKYQGPPGVSVWPGYAVLVVDKSGNRRVETGPANILLKYDESLMVLALSTGKPKHADVLHRDVYLRTINNQISDVVAAETSDFVPVQVKVSYRVNFEGEGDERLKWFDLENYVKVLTDHCRSRLRGAIKTHGVQDFRERTTDIVRDAVLGAAKKDSGRPGRVFPENGMRVIDVEVLDPVIGDQTVAGLLNAAAGETLRGAVELSQRQQIAERQSQIERIERERIEDHEKTLVLAAKAALDEIGRGQAAAMAQADGELEAEEALARVQDLARSERKADSDLNRELTELLNKVELERSKVETALFRDRMEAFSPSLISTIQDFGDRETATRVIEAIAPAAAAAGMTTADLLHRHFGGTPLESITEALARRPLAGGDR